MARNDLNDSEFTGPVFSADGKVLFANIRIPGTCSRSPAPGRRRRRRALTCAGTGGAGRTGRGAPTGRRRSDQYGDAVTRTSERRLGLLLLARGRRHQRADAAAAGLPRRARHVRHVDHRSVRRLRPRADARGRARRSGRGPVGPPAGGAAGRVVLRADVADRTSRSRTASRLLFLVRFLQGAGAGAVFTVASAWLVEAAVREHEYVGAADGRGHDDRRASPSARPSPA